MKRFMDVIVSVLLLVSLTACSDGGNAMPVQDYPLEDGTVTEILTSNGFDLSAFVSFYNDSDTTGYTYNYALDNFDETGNCEGEPVVYGTLQLEWGGEDGKSVKMVCMEDDSEFADIDSFENLKKSVYVACDVYGGIENKKQIADDFIVAIKDGKMFEDTMPYWESEYDGIFVRADFLPAHDDMPVTFRQFEVYGRERKAWKDGRWERTLQMFVDMNPYKYTLETLDHPDPLTGEQAADIISGNRWNIAISEVTNEAQTAGTERHLYDMTLPDGTRVGSVGIHYDKSGKSVGFTYLIANTDIYRSDAGVEFAVKTTCDFYGGIEDSDGLSEKVKSVLANKEFEYNQHGDPHCLIEHNGVYCMLHFGAKTPKVYEFTGFNLYSKTSLQAGIYNAAKNDNWYRKIYSELYE